ncbi:MAG TPA: hypothetical protein VFA10_31365, partial [Ktedonobacteraceae bacterium]|nr:hypothetical protein [Ktedonobacteraceae bacterium]
MPRPLTTLALFTIGNKFIMEEISIPSPATNSSTIITLRKGKGEKSKDLPPAFSLLILFLLITPPLMHG